jgi:hypothetical protein
MNAGEVPQEGLPARARQMDQFLMKPTKSEVKRFLAGRMN